MTPATLQSLPQRERRLIMRSQEATEVLDAVFSAQTLQDLERAAGAPGSGAIRRRGCLHVRTTPDPKTAAAWSFGQKIVAARSRRGWTQQDLADHCGIARANVARLESGRHAPKLDTLKRVAQALGLAVSDLVKEPGYGPGAEDSQWLESDLGEWSTVLDREDRKP